MTRLSLTPAANRDLARLTDFLSKDDPAAAEATADLIIDALLLLEQQPRIGRPACKGTRELVIHRGRSGYLALYRISADEQYVEVLAVRHQRESGWHADDL